MTSSSRRVVTALALRDRIQACETFAQSTAGQELLVVSATRMAADELARGLGAKAAGFFGIHRFSPGALAVELASSQLALSGKSVLAGVAVEALAARAVQECQGKTALHWFEPVATTTGFFRALASTLTDL